MPAHARARPRQPPASAARREPRARPTRVTWTSPEKKAQPVASAVAAIPQGETGEAAPARRAAATSQGRGERPARKTRFPVMETEKPESAKAKPAPAAAGGVAPRRRA